LDRRYWQFYGPSACLPSLACPLRMEVISPWYPEAKPKHLAFWYPVARKECPMDAILTLENVRESRGL
jgi:hypothetical protein